MEDLNSFLRRAHADWQHERASVASQRCIRLFLGNESLDLDSAVCSVICAFTDAQLDTSVACIPILHVARQDFALRTEITFLFGQLGVDTTALLFLDDVTPAILQRIQSEKRLELVLVDHNVPTGIWLPFVPAVTSIFDHHQDIFTSQFGFPLRTRQIEMVGSCATLIAHRLISLARPHLSPSIATLLMAPILVDTANFDPTLARGTARDKSVLEELRVLITLFSSTQDLFDKTQSAKLDISSLSTTDLLRKDYKQWSCGTVKYGISSVLIPIEQMLQRDDQFMHMVEGFYKREELSVLLIMTVFSASGRYQRQLGLFSESRPILTFIIDSCKDQLGLETIPAGSADQRWVVCVQRQVTASRKQLQPLLASALSKY